MASSSPDAGCSQSSDGDEKLASESEFPAEEGIYEVEKIVGISKQDGKNVYRVRWKGYGSEDDTWEPRDNLLTCEDMVEEFLEKHKDQKKRKAASERKQGKQSKPRGPQKRRGPDKTAKDFSSSSSYTSSSSMSSSSASGRSSSSSNDEEESSPKIQRTETDETQDKPEEPVAPQQHEQQQQQEHEQQQVPEKLAGDERAVLLKDPFWHQLEKGLISFSGDMYSKVKSRRATLDAKKQQQGDEKKQKKRERRKQKKDKKDRRVGHRPKHKKDKKKSKSKIDLDLLGSLESATQKTLSMSPSVLDRSENSANLFRSTSITNSEEILTVAKLEEKSRLSSSPSQSDKGQTPSESGSSTSSSSAGGGGSDGESNTSSSSGTIITDLTEQSVHEQDIERRDVSKLPSEIAALSTHDGETKESPEETMSITKQQRDVSIQEETQGSQVSDWSIDRVLGTNSDRQEQGPRSNIQRLEHDLARKVNLNTEQSSVVPSSQVGPLLPAKVLHVDSFQHQSGHVVKPPATSPQQYQGVLHQGLYQQQQNQQQLQRTAYPGVSPHHHQQHLPQQQQQQTLPQQQHQQMLHHQQQMSPTQHHHQQMSPHQQQMSPHHHQQQQLSPTYPVDHMGRAGQVPLQQGGGRMLPSMGTFSQGGAPPQLPHQQQQQQAQSPYEMKQHQQRYDPHAATRRGSKGSPTSDASKKTSNPSKQPKGKGQKEKGHTENSHQVKNSGSKAKHGQKKMTGEDNTKGSSDFEFEFEQESPDAGYQSPGKDELESPAFVSEADLKKAVIEGKTHIVRAALNMNIALNVEQPDSTGATLLMHSCIHRHEDILKLLIVQGAKVNACSKSGITPLMYVSEQGFASAAGILLEAGAFVNFKQPATGDTALINASRRGHAEVVQVLLDYGANWALANVNHTTAESFARLNNHFAVRDILNTYVKRMTRELEMSVTQYMSGTAELVKPLFPLHCIRVREACEHNIYLNHELNQYSYRQGFGNLLFLGHAAMGPGGTNCRLTGPCYVREVFLNGQLLPQLNQGSNFIVSLPLRHGHNLIKIKTIRDPYTNVIVLVGGYSMQVITP